MRLLLSKPAVIRSARLAVLAGAIISGATILARAIAGPFRFIAPVHSPIPAECIFAASCLALTLTRAGGKHAARPESPKFRWVPLLLALAAVALTFQGAPSVSFLCDDYFVVLDAVRGRGAHLFSSLVANQDTLYYRPVAYTILWFAAIPLGTDSVKWHLFSLGLHMVNCGLVYAVTARLGLPARAAAVAAVLFGIHGSRPESVVWTSGYFELISATFFLSALLLYLRSNGDRKRVEYAGALLCFLLALWSKESAYVLPLVLAVLPRREGETWRAPWRALTPFFILAAVAFAHRWAQLGGIGGYVDPQSGRSEAGSINLLRIAKLLGARLWAVLFFPIDWEVTPGPLFAFATLAAMIALLCATRFRVSRRIAYFGFLAAAITALPAASQLLIGPDLQKSRLLYLPSIGFAVLLAGVATAFPTARARAAIAAAFLVFQCAALRHNLAIWEDVSRIGRATCDSARALVRDGPRRVTVIGLPGSIRGVYFFMNGFKDCLDMGDGGHWTVALLPPGSVVPPEVSGLVLVWRNERDGLARIR